MAREHPLRANDDEQAAAPASQCRFNAIEPLGRLRAVLPAIFTRPASPDTRPLPRTSSQRRRASVVAASLDQDAHLSEKVTEQQESGTALAETPAGKETVLYLAYGSNMAEKTFRGMRGIKPLSQIPVLVPELRLTFDLPGLPYAEPCFAGTQYRDPDTAEGGDTEIEDDVSVVSDEGFLPEKAPLIVGSREVHASDYGKNGWRKPLIGIVYEVTLADYAKIIATEGGGRGYRDVVVDCHPFSENYKSSDPVPNHPDTAAFKAHALLSPAADDAQRRIHVLRSGHSSVSQTSCPKTCLLGDRGPHMRPDPDYAQPSARYLDLLVTGAAEHDLPVSYREYLSQIQTYRVTTTRQKIGRAIFLTMWGPIFLSILKMSKTFAGPDGRSPPWLVTLANVVVEVMWFSYDYFFKKVFGDGERTIEDAPCI